MSEEQMARCCFINTDGESCVSLAEWEICGDVGFEDFTLACTEHVGYLLWDAPVLYLSHIEADVAPLSIPIVTMEDGNTSRRLGR